MPDSNITKRALAQALKTLMSRTPFAKISVGDICTVCGMSRKSFYYHFKDKYDLVNWIFYSEFINEVQADDYQNAWEFLEDICAYFYRERVFYRNAMNIYGQNSFREYFSEVMEPFIQSFLTMVLHNENDSEFSQIFLTDAFLASLVRWLSHSDTMPPELYLSNLKQLLIDLSRRILLDFDATAPDTGNLSAQTENH